MESIGKGSSRTSVGLGCYLSEEDHVRRTNLEDQTAYSCYLLASLKLCALSLNVPQ
jgi:hypothetical protein